MLTQYRVNIVDIAMSTILINHRALDMNEKEKKKTKAQKHFNFDHWTMKMKSRSDDTCQLDMYILQSFHYAYTE